MNRLISICIIACVAFIAPSLAAAQTQPTIIQRHLLQSRVVHTANLEKLILAIGEAFFDLRMQSVGINATLFPAYLDSIRTSGTEVTYTGKTIGCGKAGGLTVSDPDCGQNVTVQLSYLKDDQYLIKLVVNGSEGESFNTEVYRKYFEAISKSLFLEKANLELDAPTQY